MKYRSNLFWISATVGLVLCGAGCATVPPSATQTVPSSTAVQPVVAPQASSTSTTSETTPPDVASQTFPDVESFRQAIYEETDDMENNQATDRYFGKPALIQFDGHPKAQDFKTALTKGEALGPNAAGRFTVIPVGMTGWGELTWIVDAETGKIIVDDEVATCGWRYSIDSDVIIENPVEGECMMAGSPKVWKVTNGELQDAGPQVFGHE
ncbi:MAG: hypothetical protein WA001_03980 [Patescibacteria group bacterium]